MIEQDLDQAIDLILRLRLIVARAGEKDGLGWWDSDALSPAGAYVLQRIFPRSASWAGIELAIEAATIRHKGMLGSLPALSLFTLGAEWDHRVSGYMQHLLRERQVVPIPGTIQSSSELAELLRESGGVTSDDFPPPEAATLFEPQVLEVGQTQNQGPLSAEEVLRLVKLLTASYTRGDKGRLLVPYIRVVRR